MGYRAGSVASPTLLRNGLSNRREDDTSTVQRFTDDLAWLRQEGFFQQSGVVERCLLHDASMTEALWKVLSRIQQIVPGIRIRLVSLSSEPIIQRADIMVLIDREISIFPGLLIQTQAKSTNIVQVEVQAQPAVFSMIQRMERTLAEFSQLEADWDSYQADPISQQAIAHTQRLLSLLVEQFWLSLGPQSMPKSMVPATDGSVQLEWHNSVYDLEIAIDPKGRYDGLLLDLGKGTEEGNDALSLADVFASVKKVVRLKE